VATVGILGLPNVGKTTLFNALTALGAPTAAHPFSTTEPNVGVARVPDDLLDRAAELEGSGRIVHATLELSDLPAMAGPGHTGLAAKFLGRLREVDALAVVLRSFQDPGVPDDDSGIDTADQAETLLLELALADAEVFTRRSEKAAKEATADPSLRRAADAVARAAALLEQGTHLRTVPWMPDELDAFRDLAPLTLKPAVWVVNLGEEEAESHVDAVTAVVPESDVVVALSALIEEEAAALDPADRAEFFEGFGLGVGALSTMVRATYRALDLISFYTLVGTKEAAARTVARGATAREAAGKVHSDMERGFIRAEVAPLSEVVAAGGWDSLKASGGTRLEGGDYEVAEGDVLLIRFSV
jgi:GTP-binding protein YchF